MNKVPVGRTIAAAYQFTFGQLGTIIGLIWLPLVVLAVLNFLPEIAGNTGDAGDNTLVAGTREAGNLAISLLTLLLQSVIYVAVTRQALGLRQGAARIHFALGQPEFRLFGALFLVDMMLVGLLLLVIFTVYAAGALAEAERMGPAADAVASLAGILGALAAIYVIIRLGSLVTPTTVVENRIDLRRSWTITRGNVLRIIVIFLAVLAPVMILEALGMFAVAGREVLAAMPPAGVTDPKSIEQQMDAIQTVIFHHAPGLTGVILILAPFSDGLSVAAAAFAFRALSASAPAAKS